MCKADLPLIFRFMADGEDSNNLHTDSIRAGLCKLKWPSTRTRSHNNFHYILIKIRLKFNHNSSRDHFGLIYGSFWDALRVTLDFFGIILQLLCGHLGHVRATVGYFEVTSGVLWGEDFEDMAVHKKENNHFPNTLQ